MKRKCSMLLALVLLMGIVAEAEDAQEAAAEKAAKSWLVLIDSGRFDDAANGLSDSAKAQNPHQAWVVGLNAARGGLGKLVSRKQVNLVHDKTPDGRPDATHLWIVYSSSFVANSRGMAAKKEGTERMSMVLERTGVWKPSGYGADVKTTSLGPGM